MAVITTVEKDDILTEIDNTIEDSMSRAIFKDKVVRFTEEQMDSIANKMEEAYTGGAYWADMKQAVAEVILEKNL